MKANVGKFGSMVLPDHFFVEEHVQDGVTSTTIDETELSEARDLAIANPGRYVRVGQMRWLYKEPSAWCSEVNRGEKKSLQGFDGRFTAFYWRGDNTRVGLAGQKEWGKGIMFTPNTTEKPEVA